MLDPTERAKMIEAARGAHTRHAANRDQQANADADRAPRAGDVYHLKATAAYDVVWAITAHDPADGRFLVVPLDAGTQVGTADVAVRDDPDSAPRVARCTYGAWVERETLASGHRVDTLSEIAAGHIRSKWHDLGDGRLTGNALQKDTDEDPEYEDWIQEVVASARRALPPVVERGLRPIPIPAAHALRRYATAATAIIALGAALGGGHLWRQDQRVRELAAKIDSADRRHRDEVERVAEQHRRETDRFVEEGRTREALHATAVEALRAAAEQAEGALRSRVAALTKRLSETMAFAVVNPVVQFLEARSSSRGDPIEIEVSDATGHTALSLQVAEARGEVPFRVSIRVGGEATARWQATELWPSEIGEIWIIVPVKLLPRGLFTLEVDRWDGTRYVELSRIELFLVDVAGS